jgi:hypothetical protein
MGQSSVEDDNPKLPEITMLLQNYPNPFNGTTIIKYYLPLATSAQIQIYNLLGQRVAVLDGTIQSAGWNSITWNPGELSSGIYLARLTTPNTTNCIKMFLLK